MYLDAGVLLGYANELDVHHAAASRFLEANARETFVSNPVNLGESLIRAVEADVAEKVLETYEIIGVLPLDLPGGAAGAIARIRVESRVRMPDASAIYSCEANGAELATTDAALAKAAERRGITTHLVGA